MNARDDAPAVNGGMVYFPYIDGLRALAVLSVMVYHLNAAWLPGGFSGVDIFFVISGYIVSAASGALDRASIGRFFAAFYARRFIRIIPALLVCLLATCLATALLVPSAWLSNGHQQTGIFAFFGLSNFILARTQNDYFSTTTELNPYTHTWSLGVEEQFYLIFPFLFFWWGLQGKGRALALFAVGFAISLGCAIFMTDRVYAFYMILCRFWELAAGVMLYQFMSLTGRRFDVAEQALPAWFKYAAFGALALVGYGLVHSAANTFPFPGAIFPVLGTLGLLFFLQGQSRENILARFLGAAPILFVGRISYSLYLWHWPVFVMFRWTLGLDSAISMAMALILAFVLATLSYYWVETPMRRHLRLKRLARPAVIGLGILCVGSATWLAQKINAAQPRIAINTVTRNAVDWYPDRLIAASATPDCVFNTASRPLGNSYVVEYTPQGCPLLENAAPLFAVGDSHAQSYTGLYALYALETGRPVTLYINGGCPFLSLQPEREESAHCRDNAQQVMQDILARLQPGDTVFLPSLRLPRYADQNARYSDQQVRDAIHSPAAAQMRVKAAQSAQDILRQIHERGGRAIIEAPKPIFRTVIFRCAGSYNSGNGACASGTEMPRQELEALRKPVMEALEELARKVPDVSVWDPFPILCPDKETCRAFDGDHPLFFDGDHISAYANRRLLPFFIDFIQRRPSLSARTLSSSDA
jgi:peptidoglycan/LPS O-acetylase OafA/YrhL